ncbi:MAG: class I SAM-dependent methyltransferase [Oscillospiraceae bacterium]|nr:class I SAM-dependent methyltransferase [Oscillospiraceae bacterium]
MNNVAKQYKNSDHLNTRISIHDKYSTNKQPFGDWIVSHYEIAPGDHILELGCGTGSMWKNNLHLLSCGARLTLTDFSEGMLEAARTTLAGAESITFRQADIQAIPFPDASFDVVIANMMLYHVPNLHKGLAEVRRVLKPGGKFYCATYGIHGIMEYITDLLRDMNVRGSIGTSFTLQNGGDSLGKQFEKVRRLDREDGLAITDIGDFADYIYSLSGLTNMENVPRQVLLAALESRVENGILYVPKEYGMFICQ